MLEASSVTVPRLSTAGVVLVAQVCVRIYCVWSRSHPPPLRERRKEIIIGTACAGSKHAINKAWRPRAPVCASRFLVTPSSSSYPSHHYFVSRYGRRCIGLSREVCPSEVGAARYAFPSMQIVGPGPHGMHRFCAAASVLRRAGRHGHECFDCMETRQS